MLASLEQVLNLFFSKKLNRKIVPFGPYLVIGFTISLFFGPDLFCGICICFNKRREKMPKFKFKAKDLNNKIIHGVFFAKDEEDLRAIISNLDYYLLVLKKFKKVHNYLPS